MKVSARPSHDGQRQLRVERIAQMMADGSWSGAKWQREELAAEWGVTAVHIRHYSAEAHRLLAVDPARREALRRELANRLMRIADAAEQRKSLVTGLPDLNAALKAIELYGKFSSVTDAADGGPVALTRVEVIVLDDKK